MASPSSIPSIDTWLSFSALPDPSAQPLPYLLTVALLFAALYAYHDAYNTKFPHVNPHTMLEFTSSRVKKIFTAKAIEMSCDRFENHPDEPFRIFTSDVGEMTILPPKYANEIRNDPRLDLQAVAQKMFHAYIPGFEAFRIEKNRLLEDVVRKKLTNVVAQVTEPISIECEAVMQELFGEEMAWHEVPARSSSLMLIARMSSKIFLGEELCRNEAWLKITIAYTINVFQAAQKLSEWPLMLRPLAQWMMPECVLLRKQVAEARSLISGVIKKRKEDRAAAKAQGKGELEFNDAIEWFEKESKGRNYDPTVRQLSLSTFAIHTTSDLLNKVVITLADHPDYIERLREELMRVLSDGGWKKTSLYNLKLLDSVIKETQRYAPPGFISMRRRATTSIKLQDGTYIPRGTCFAVSNHRMWDQHLHDSPEEWRGDRFLNLREKSGSESAAQLVSTSPDHLAFGHGQHACPGRFFAATEIKLALCHLILKYDWKLADGSVPRKIRHGWSIAMDPTVKLMIRRRPADPRIPAVLY